MDQPHSHHVPNTVCDMILQLHGLRWHEYRGLTPRPISVVETPQRGYGHAFVVPPWIWCRGIRNETRPPFRPPF